MKKFVFRLQPLLKYRQYLEHIAKQELAKAYQNVRDVEILINSLEELYSRKAAELDNEAVNGIRAQYFKQCIDYLGSLENEIKSEKIKLANLRKVLAEKQAKLTRKSVEKKVIERLRQKKENDYMNEFRKEEQKESDEMASLKKARQIKEAAL